MFSLRVNSVILTWFEAPSTLFQTIIGYGNLLLGREGLLCITLSILINCGMYMQELCLGAARVDPLKPTCLSYTRRNSIVCSDTKGITLGFNGLMANVWRAVSSTLDSIKCKQVCGRSCLHTTL